jgi:hypothetical protein
MPPIADASKLGPSQCRPNSWLDKTGYAGSPGLNAIIPLQRVNPVIRWGVAAAYRPSRSLKHGDAENQAANLAKNLPSGPLWPTRNSST